jgi:hypothetical protein
MPGDLKIVADQAAGRGVQRHIADLAALAEHLEVRHAAPLVFEVLDLQPAQLLAP